MFNTIEQKIKKVLLSVLVLGVAVSFSPGMFPSEAQAASQSPAVQPKFSPSGGSVQTGDKITLSSSTSGATIYYTINGSTPTTSSYKYSGSVDLQPGNGYFVVGSYTVKAIAVKSGYSNSSVTQASFSVTNQDKSQRKKLSDEKISVNHDDCWMEGKTKCTSLSGMRSATINEIIYFAKACNSWVGGSYTNKCEVELKGGTEAGHSTGSCAHDDGYKFDMGVNSKVSNYIKTSNQFTYQGLRKIDKAPMYKWKSGGAIYSLESDPDHWDVLVGC